MRLLFLASDFDVTNGWGRYSAGFLKEARARHGAEDVVAPDPALLRAQPDGWHVRFLYPLAAARAAWKLRKNARGVDLIHAATEPTLPHAFFLSLFTGVPYVVSAHGTYGDLRTYGAGLRWFYRLAFRRAARIIAVSGYTAEVVRREIPSAKLSIVPGGYASRAQTNGDRSSHAERRILAVGAIKPRKGFHTLVEALGILKTRGFRFRADCLGPKGASAYVARLEARVMELGLDSHVRFAGRVSEEELEAAYADADLFVLPSEHEGTAFEGLGLVYLEAMAHGLPVIGCLDSGATDVIRDGVNGFLVPPGDAERLADAIARVLNDAELWKKMSESAPRSIDRFRWERVGADMESVYTHVIDEYAR